MVVTDGGAILENKQAYPPTKAKAGYGVAGYKIVGEWTEKARGDIELAPELLGPVELDKDGDYFLGARKLTTHTVVVPYKRGFSGTPPKIPEIYTNLSKS